MESYDKIIKEMKTRCMLKPGGWVDYFQKLFKLVKPGIKMPEHVEYFKTEDIKKNPLKIKNKFGL
jgi:hypothetical protein